MTTPEKPSARAARLALCLFLAATPALADGDAHESFSQRPDAHAPIGVMGDHTHRAGGWMLSYRYARMRMDGNRSRTQHDSIQSIVGTPANPGPFLVAPTDMDMQMHMFGLMWAPIDRVTLTAMLPLTRLSMDHRRRDGVEFDTHSDGIGDFKAGALVGLWRNENHEVHLNASISFPTGSIREKDTLPPPAGRQRLPYPMQLGSGTYDLIPGLTYTGHTDWLSWGLQGIATIRTGRNSLDYRLGNRIDTTAWLAHPWADWISTSARADFSAWGNITGEDDALNPNMVPTADPNRRGGRELDLLAGVNLYVPLGPLGRHRFAVEAGAPVVQWLDGPQLQTKWKVVVGWQKAFHGLPGL